MNNTTIIYRSPSEIDNLVHAFQECSLPRSQWNHAAHLTAALWYLFYDSEPEAVNAIRNGIKRYNSVQGIESTKDTRYHETLTLFWMRIVRGYLAEESRNRSIVSLANGVIAQYAARNLPFCYYTRDRLMSWEARLNWVEPDLRAIDSKIVAIGTKY